MTIFDHQILARNNLCTSDNIMQAPKSLSKPLNWQDFEILCKKLWGEIWKRSEIKKNGRSGQL